LPRHTTRLSTTLITCPLAARGCGAVCDGSVLLFAEAIQIHRALASRQVDRSPARMHDQPDTRRRFARRRQQTYPSQASCSLCARARCTNCDSGLSHLWWVQTRGKPTTARLFPSLQARQQHLASQGRIPPEYAPLDKTSGDVDPLVHPRLRPASASSTNASTGKRAAACPAVRHMLIPCHALPQLPGLLPLSSVLDQYCPVPSLHTCITKVKHAFLCVVQSAIQKVASSLASS
jgi:hypothetical protein